MRWPPEAFADAGIVVDGSRTPPPGAARGLGVLVQGCSLAMPVQGARECLLEAKEFLGSFFLAARASDVVGHGQGPRALDPERLLGEEVAEALPEPHHPCMTEGEVARRTTQDSPLRC